MEKKEKRYRNPGQRRGIQKLLMIKLIEQRQKRAKRASQFYIANRFMENRKKEFK